MCEPIPTGSGRHPEGETDQMREPMLPSVIGGVDAVFDPSGPTPGRSRLC
jgi:hypothetical protein